MSNHYRKLLWLIPFVAVIAFLFACEIPEGFAANQLPPVQAETLMPDPRASRTLPPTYTATLPEAAPPINATPQPGAINPQDTILTENQAPIAAAVPDLGTATPLPDVSSFPNQAVFSFRDIGTTTFTMHFPDTYSFNIDLPDRWQVSPSQSYLEVQYTLAEDFGNKVATRSPLGNYRYGIDRPTIEVHVDEQLAGVITPDVGDHTARIKLPFGMLEWLRWNPANEHTVTFNYFYGADVYCDYSGVITIHDVSTINLGFNVLAPTLNLSIFPQPLIQSSFIPEVLLVVVPDDANENDLTMVAKLSAAIGRAAPNINLKINVVRSSEASSVLLSKSSAVFIGTPQRNRYLSSLFLNNKFVTKISADGNTIQGVGTDQGLLQLAFSDINPKNAYLAITGNNDEGVNRALNDLVYPPVGMSGIFFISQVAFTPQYNPTPPPDTYRLSDFNFRERPAYGIGTQKRSLDFFIPRNWAIQDGVKLIATYAHSLNLSYDNSGIAVLLNGTPIGNIPMNANDYGEVQFVLPIKKENLIPGALNTIRFEITLERDLDCTFYDARVTWFNVRDSSLLYIPYKLITDPKELPAMHDPIFYLANEPKFLISLPERPNSQELNGMASFVRVLGTQLRYPYFDIKVSTDPRLDPTAFSDYNFVGIGRPSRNPFIQIINNELPQPFVPGQDTLTLQQKIGDYRIEQSIGVGIVQALESPWNKMRGVTVITATNDEAFKWVMDKITDYIAISEFTGELSFVQTDIVQSFERGVPLHMNVASLITGLTGKPASLEPVVPTTAADQSKAPAPAPGDKYVLPKPVITQQVGIYIVLGIVVIGIIIAGIGITRTIRGGRKR